MTPEPLTVKQPAMIQKRRTVDVLSQVITSDLRVQSITILRLSLEGNCDR